MKVKNIVRKAVALGTGAGVFATTIVGALAYDLSTYPAKYIVDGQFDGKIVVGERAATADVLGSIDIAASLQSASTSAVSVPGQAGAVTLSGDVFQLSTGSDALELREPISGVTNTVTRTQLAGLKSGRISTSEGTTDYNQFIRFEAGSATWVDMAVNYVKNRGADPETMADYLVVPRDTGTQAFIEWEIQFPQGLESEITVNTGVDSLDDLEDKTINIMGTDYTIVQATYDGSDVVTLTLMGGSVPDTLREGETKTYNINGVVYEVTLVFVSDPNGGTPEAKFSVNGELTDSMTEGATEILSGGLQIGVRDILVNAREGVASFFLGADKLELTAENITGTYGGDVTVNDDVTESDVVSLTAQETQSGSVLEITSIKYRVFMDSADGSAGIAYVPAGHGVRELMEEPELLVSDTLDIRYEGLTEPRTADVMFESVGEDQYEMTFTNVLGTEYSFTIASVVGSAINLGEEDYDFIYTETNVTSSYPIGINDVFIVGKDSGEDKSVTNVLEFSNYRRSQRQVEFQEVGQSGAIVATMSGTGTTGNGTFTVGGNTYTVQGTGLETADPTVRVDLNADSVWGNGTAIDITAWGGLIIDIAETDADTLTFTGTVPADRFDTSGAESFTWTIDEATDELQLTFNSASYAGPLDQGVGGTTADNRSFNFHYDTLTRNSETYVAMTDYGILVTVVDPDGADEKNELTLSVPEEQRIAQVFLTMGETSATTTSAGGAQRVNPIAVGLAVLDTDAPAVGTENLIVVGGPCANTVAAELLGNPSNCAEGFEPGRAVIRSWDKGNTVAILVAGYEATETLGASRVLASYRDYSDKLTGSEVEVVVADLNSIQVRAR